MTSRSPAWTSSLARTFMTKWAATALGTALGPGLDRDDEVGLVTHESALTVSLTSRLLDRPHEPTNEPRGHVLPVRPRRRVSRRRTRARLRSRGAARGRAQIGDREVRGIRDPGDVEHRAHDVGVAQRTRVQPPEAIASSTSWTVRHIVRPIHDLGLEGPMARGHTIAKPREDVVVVLVDPELASDSDPHRVATGTWSSRRGWPGSD